MTDPRKPIFDAVRAAVPGVWGDPHNIQAMDNLLDAYGVPRASGEMRVSPAGIKLIQDFEGFAKALPDGRVQAYPDPATGGAPWTIGWGTTGPDVRAGTVWTRDQAQKRFEAHVSEFANGVTRALAGSATTQSEFDAMVSLAYNVGLANFSSSTLLKKHKAGDKVGAKAEFARWNKAAGKVMAGLTRRRAAEAALYGA
ncbi:GH24 family phage-related lysozyme (muramidase) [Sphingobium sp. B1D7B]|uniref:lysozyme n=1 Tax=Sphingobium sp. B1D7B TaxID=2940578 RepID=UPI0022245919|nr:lysozyme [Sphingobium sp. B1D7B]MCW2405022.1 GH24 family phage-related lysozyme (muramidase) [Sphingobium sp. B1D7B]